VIGAYVKYILSVDVYQHEVFIELLTLVSEMIDAMCVVISTAYKVLMMAVI